MTTVPNLIKDAEGTHRILYKSLSDLVAGGDKIHTAAQRLYSEMRQPEARDQLSEVMAHVEAARKFSDAAVADARAAFSALKALTGCNGTCEKQ